MMVFSKYIFECLVGHRIILTSHCWRFWIFVFVFLLFITIHHYCCCCYTPISNVCFQSGKNKNQHHEFIEKRSSYRKIVVQTLRKKRQKRRNTFPLSDFQVFYIRIRRNNATFYWCCCWYWYRSMQKFSKCVIQTSMCRISICISIVMLHVSLFMFSIPRFGIHFYLFYYCCRTADTNCWFIIILFYCTSCHLHIHLNGIIYLIFLRLSHLDLSCEVIFIF